MSYNGNENTRTNGNGNVKRVMILGTGSNVGKSLITAGFCRILNDRGVDVAPFKAQNMALNSYITKEGHEMGRAQVVQAEAARVDPHSDMNPILLKPTGERKSQVIVHGKVHDVLSATEYYAAKAFYKDMVKVSYERLSDIHEAIVMEGAGSPAEINLLEQDIVNMGMAEMADAPVILVGDIDRGGVFAQLYGTVKLLPEHMQARIKGFVVNKFRGDVSILEPGLRMIEELTGIPVLGVMPYVDVDIEDEDSLSERFRAARDINAAIRIGVIRLPKVSNFTDLNVLETFPGVSVEYYRPGDGLGDVDLIVIPGSKSTIDDLMAIRNSGLEEQIIRKHKQGVPVLGICGGYQILGRQIHDPHGTESEIPSVNGMGLLDVATTFHTDKTTTLAEAVVKAPDFLSGLRVNGYEIHMGETVPVEGGSAVGFSTIDKLMGTTVEKSDGAALENAEGTWVIGTYLHGILDNLEFTERLINHLRNKKGLEATKHAYESFEAYKDAQYDALAKAMELNLDIDAMVRIMEGKA